MEELKYYIVSGDDMILETRSFITSVVRKGATMTIKISCATKYNNII